MRSVKLLEINFKLVHNHDSNIILSPFHNIENQHGNAVTIAILHLEYIIEILENKEFHESLVSYIDMNKSNEKSIIQEHFMSLADSILQLLVISNAAEQGYDYRNTIEQHSNNDLMIHIDNKLLKLTSRSIGNFGIDLSLWPSDLTIKIKAT